MGYTHVEIMQLHEHPLDKSSGNQATEYYSSISRHRDSIELKELINKLHKNDICRYEVKSFLISNAMYWIREFNEAVYKNFPGVVTVAEESFT